MTDRFSFDETSAKAQRSGSSDAVQYTYNGAWDGSRLSQSGTSAPLDSQISHSPSVKGMLNGFQLVNDSRPVAAAPVSAGDKSSLTDPDAKFSLGVAPGKLPTELRGDVRQLSGALQLQSIQTSDNVAPISGDGYVYGAVNQMVGKYGSDRIGQVLNGLSQISPSELRNLSMDLSSSQNSDDPTKSLNQKLGRIAALAEPGGVENVEKLAQEMRSEGYTKTMSTQEMTPEFVNHMLSSESERNAYIKFQQGDFGAVQTYLGAHPDAFTDWHTKSFQEQYKDFQRSS
jgi:hypothetical protein